MPLVLQYLMLLMLLTQLCLLISMNCKVQNYSEFKAKMIERLSFSKADIFTCMLGRGFARGVGDWLKR